jgi:hypothetical protein
LPANGAIAGLCPQCLLSLALQDSALDRDSDEAPAPDGQGSGRILGERYQIRAILGRGGMGEVWRAFDLKLRVDVALKAVLADRAENERARDMLRREVRSAREVVSPNVCRIFDLVVEEGQELVSMEFIDGTTLAETLRVRGPLPLPEAREIASQFLSGIEAIHHAGQRRQQGVQRVGFQHHDPGHRHAGCDRHLLDHVVELRGVRLVDLLGVGHGEHELVAEGERDRAPADADRGHQPGRQDARLAPGRHRVGGLAFQQPADDVPNQRGECCKDDDQDDRVAPVDLLRRDEVRGRGHARLPRSLSAARSSAPRARSRAC